MSDAPGPPPGARKSPGGLIPRVLVHTLFVAAVYGRYFWPLHAYGIVDTDRFLATQLAVNDALRSGSLLYWSPYACGGAPVLADPEGGVLSPFNLLSFFFDPVTQQKMELLVHLALCAAGFELLARRLRIRPWASVAGFFIAAGNGFVVFRVLHGQSTFYPLLLVPLLVACVWPALDAENRPLVLPLRPALGALALVSLMVLEDGFQVLVHASVLLVCISGAVSVAARSLRPLATIAAVLGVPVILCAPRTFPLFLFLAGHPSRVPATDFLTPSMASDALFSSSQMFLYETFVPSGQHLPWAAYGAFLGFVPILLAALALAARPSPVVAGLGIAAVAGVAIFFGNFAPWSPWAVLHGVPPLTMVRFPNWFISVTILSVSVLAMIGIDLVPSFLLERTFEGMSKLAFSGLLFVLALSFAGVTGPVFRAYVRTRAHEGRIHRARPFHVERGRPGALLHYTSWNVGSVACTAPFKLPNHVRPEWKEAFVLGAGTATLDVRPNEYTIDVDAREPTTLVVNQNYAPEFRVVEGRTTDIVRSMDGLLSVEIPAGRQRIRLAFDPFAFRLGLAMSTVSLAGVAFWAIRRRGRGERGET